MTALTTPAQISAFRFMSLRSQLKMEKVGLKSSVGALRPKLAKEFGLRARDSYDAYIAFCTKKIVEAATV